MTAKRATRSEEFLRLYQRLDERERAYIGRLLKALVANDSAAVDATLTAWLGRDAAAAIAEFAANRAKRA